MSDIRVTYSGLIALTVSLVGLITGTIFVIMVTRKLSPEDLGLWTLIGSIVSYVLVVEPIISYWTTRQIARGEKISRSALSTSSLFSVGGVGIYFAIALFVSFYLGADIFVLTLAAFLVPLMFLNNTLDGICLSYKPHSISYGIVAFETSKIPLGLLFVVFLHLGISGAIITTIIASLIRVFILLVSVRRELVGSINKETIKFWLRMFWLPMYTHSPGLIHKLDVLVFSSFTHSFVGLAYWGASAVVANLVGHSGNISQALYSKLIATRKKEFAEENLKRTTYFAIPILAASIILARPILHVLNPIYVDGVFIVYFLAFRSFVGIFVGMFFNIMSAYESVDLDKKASFKEYIKSKLFLIPTLSFIMSFSYIISLIVFLMLLKTPDMTETYMVTVWAIIQFAVMIPFLIYGFISVRKHHQVALPHVAIVKYSIATIVASIIVFLVSQNIITYMPSIWSFMPQLITILAIGGAIYLSLTYAIDKSTRELFKSIVKEIKK